MNPNTLQLPADVADAFAEADAARIRAHRQLTDRTEIAGEQPLTEAGLRSSLVDRAAIVRETLADNPWCPTWALEELAGDRNVQVARSARHQLVARRGILPAEHASRDQIDAAVAHIIEHHDDEELSTDLYDLARDTWGFTAQDVETILAARSTDSRLRQSLLFNRSLDAAALEAADRGGACGFTTGNWIAHPGCPPERLAATIQRWRTRVDGGDTSDGFDANKFDAAQAARHRNCPTASVVQAIGCVDLTQVAAYVDLTHPDVLEAVFEQIRLYIERRKARSEVTSPRVLAKALARNPTAPAEVFEVLFDATGIWELRWTLSDLAGDPRVDVDFYAENCSMYEHRRTLVVLARMSSGRSEAADMFRAALALAEDDPTLTYGELSELAGALVH